MKGKRVLTSKVLAILAGELFFWVAIGVGTRFFGDEIKGLLVEIIAFNIILFVWVIAIIAKPQLMEQPKEPNAK